MNKIKYLEGLRGICCLIVIVDHCVNRFKPDIRYTALDNIGGFIRRLVAWTPVNIIYSGIASVCIFFILSGFVLSIKFNQTQDDSIIISGAIKRYPRLVMPILAAMMLMYVMYILVNAFTGQDLNLSFFKAVKEALYYAPFKHVELANDVLWTISFEIYGSFIVFFLLALVGSHCNRLALYSIVFTFFYWSGSYYCLFIMGMMLSDIYTNYNFSINKKFRLLLFVIGLILATSPYKRDGVELYKGLYNYMKVFNVQDYHTLYHMLMLTGSMILFISVLGSNLAEKTLNMQLFQFLGKISFPLYINHLTILNTIGYFLHQKIGDLNLYLFLMITSISIIISIIISVIFERYVDMPSIKVANKVAKKLR